MRYETFLFFQIVIAIFKEPNRKFVTKKAAIVCAKMVTEAHDVINVFQATTTIPIVCNVIVRLLAVTQRHATLRANVLV